MSALEEARMLAIQLPDDIERRLDALAKATGRRKVSYLQEAIVEYLGDLEDFHLAEQRLADIQAGRAGTVSLAEGERDLGLED
jgi:RHH-type rel operon transcriptional repressor/antitoxin RelB